jgi:hypothetical protein
MLAAAVLLMAAWEVFVQKTRILVLSSDRHRWPSLAGNIQRRRKESSQPPQGGSCVGRSRFPRKAPSGRDLCLGGCWGVRQAPGMGSVVHLSGAPDEHRWMFGPQVLE